MRILKVLFDTLFEKIFFSLYVRTGKAKFDTLFVFLPGPVVPELTS